jgi:hypothetical protein
MADAFRTADALLAGQYGRKWYSEDGWWVTTIFHEFGFIDEYGFAFESLSLHHTGHYLVFRGPCQMLKFYYARGVEAGGIVQRIGADSWSSLDSLLRIHGAGDEPPPIDHEDNESVRARVHYWATGLRRLAPTMLTCESEASSDTAS